MFVTYFIYNSIYVDHINNNSTRFISNILPLPAGTANNDLFFYKDVFALDLLAQKEFEQEDHFSYAIEAVVKQKLLDQLIDELNLEFKFLAPDEINTSEYEAYGWNEKMYKKYLLEPLQQSEILQSAVLDCSNCQLDVRMEMEHVASLLDMGIGFSDLAKQYSEVASSQFGGDVGFVKLDDIDEELKSIWDFEIGEMSDVIELSDRFVIAKVYDVTEVGSEREQIGLQIIVMYKNGLSEVLSDRKELAEVKIF
ncbi:peptidyl-prolyl cis-trans isomerase [Patescibacteria group bacterium]|nr:peptidyl-prolyl cis-trans isomerase [Patescibacteria group bacterium]MBU4453303.1 peptidyl-prolyl cis-trans isomerase [Patescibacteria group bacterium]MCG2687872.1 peptidyl-prolyl cis-trans isomerase [Candidatus Parcubacteria bacterium]